MNVVIENMPACKIAYVRKIGPYGAGNVDTMERLKSWAGTNQLLNDRSIILGIAHDNPEKTKPEDCRYDTCLVVEKDYVVHDANVREGEISGGRYAVFLIPHTAEAVQKAWGDIFPELFKLGLQYDEARPILERYKGELVRNHYCEICVPILSTTV